MTLKLRAYQTRAVSDLLKLLKKKRRVVAVSPTGSGKTVIAASLIRKLRGKRVLWVAHRIELLKQAYDQLLAAGIPERDLGILSGPAKKNEGARVLVAFVGMFKEREVPTVDLVVIDEAHRAAANSYREIISAQPDALLLGLTATPQRLDGKPLNDAFDEMYVVAQSVDLIAGGYVAHAACFGIPKTKARSIVKGVRAGKDFNEHQLAKAMSKRALMGDIVKECARLAPDAATIVFAVNREHGRALLVRFKHARRTAEYLDGETPDKQRADIIKRLKAGVTQVVVNVDVLTEGFDCPPVKCIALARPTKSLTRFLQQVGRASRPWHRKRPIILDHAGNCWRFGLPEASREWSLGGNERGAGGAMDLVRHCLECGHLNRLNATACDECGAEFPKTERELAEHDAKLRRIEATEREKAATLKRIRAVAKLKGVGESWVQRVLAEMFGATQA